MKLSGLSLLIFLCCAIACQTNGVFEKMAFFGKQEWRSNDKQSFKFDITDTTAQYRLYFVIRHTDAYRWNNIWVDIAVQSPDSTFHIRREFVLSDNKKWHGTAVDDVVEQRIPFDKSNSPISLRKGSYTFTLQHVMREDPLQHVLNAGIRVEKVK